MTERRAYQRAGPLLRWYYATKYRLFNRERRPHDGRRGVIMLQVDALAYADLRRAIDRGFCPTIERLLRESDFTLRRWFCGLPSATPYCQAGIFHGENPGIPAFRFYDKPARKIITCNASDGVQYIRDRIKSPGALAGGSSYVNLMDGDAQTVAFTVATRERMSVYQRLGGGRMAMLIVLHPIRIARMVVQSVLEYLLEEWERLRGELARQATHSEGIFPFIRILSNVIIRELQTMAILLDVYLGVPVIYSTFMQYDELAHHFGPSSKQALSDLRRTDARISEIWRMARLAGGRQYDLVILSDHGMTPAQSYRVQFRESLGATVERMLDGDVLASHSEASEYAHIGPEVIEAVAVITPPARERTRRALRLVRDWLRSRYGLREIILPEKYRVAATHDVVVTYSSCLALLYFAADARQLMLSDILGDPRRRRLYSGLLDHDGIGLIITRTPEGVHVEGKAGKALLKDGAVRVVEGRNPMDPYGTESYVVNAVEYLATQSNAGDCILFGAYDGYDIVSFDDQVGAHGSAGGDQVYPFIIAPSWLGLADETLEDARDIHRAVLLRYSDPSVDRGRASSPMQDRSATI
ncbi:MAG: alkaline phosphatase family protein [Gemmatimonadaceae bacterium]|nr:alkaline phosphatase family protein [Gemmatimonadaceae bacterium]